MISCICITQNRRFFLRRAVDYFFSARKLFEQSQETAWAELVILDGSAEPNDEFKELSVEYFHEPSPPHARTGALHNRACELARGDIIIQWDDDDWQSPERIVKQVKALSALSESFVYTSNFYWYHLAERRACKARSWGPGGSAGATFAYHRKTWETAPFRENAEQGEDNFFWDDHQKRGTLMIDMGDPSLLVYIRHNRNGSPAISDAYTPEDTEKARAIMGADVAFYDELSEILPVDQWNNPHARWKETWDRQQMQRFAAQRRTR